MRAYSRSSARTSKASANLRAVLGLAMRRSSSKSEMESADTPVLDESSRRLILRSSRTRLSCCSSGKRNVYPSGRPDNRGWAGPEAAAVFRGRSLIRLSESSEGEAIYEKEQSMSTETKPDYAGMAHEEIRKMNERRGLVAAELQACEAELAEHRGEVGS